jgi:hypothetical protein
MINWKIIKANFKPDYTIELEFADGVKGSVQILSSRLIKVFSPLKDVNLFLKGYLKYGAVTWNVGEYELDLAPDTMYEKIKKNKGLYIIQ